MKKYVTRPSISYTNSSTTPEEDKDVVVEQASQLMRKKAKLLVVMVVIWSIASHLSTAARIFDISLLPTTHLFEISRQTKWVFQSPSDTRSLEMGFGRLTRSRTLSTHIS